MTLEGPTFFNHKLKSIMSARFYFIKVITQKNYTQIQKKGEHFEYDIQLIDT